MAFRWSRNLFMKFLLIWARLYCERRCRRLNAKNISKIIRRWHLKLNLYEMHDNRNEIKRNEFNDVKNASGHNWSRSRNFRNDFDLLINFFFFSFLVNISFFFWLIITYFVWFGYETNVILSHVISNDLDWLYGAWTFDRNEYRNGGAANG